MNDTGHVAGDAARPRPRPTKQQAQRHKRAAGIRTTLKGLNAPGGSAAFTGASLIARTDGRLAARVTLPDGRYRYLYGQDEAEIIRRAMELAQTGESERPQGDRDMSLGAHIERWLASRDGLKPSTLAYYRRNLDGHVTPALKRKPVAKITKDDLLALYRASRAEGLSARSVVHLHASLSTVLQAAEDDDGIRNVARSIKKDQRPRAGNHELAILEGDQVARFIQAARGERLEALFITAVTTGLRRGEILGLRWRDIDFKRSELRVRYSLQGTTRHNLTLGRPKTDSAERTIPLGSLALDALRAHQKRQDAESEVAGSKWEVPAVVKAADTELVFPTAFGGFLSPTTLMSAFHRIAKRGGVTGQGLRFHDLRHTAITAWLHDGTDPKTASTMAGHASVGITLDLYGHATTTSQRAAADRRDQRLRRMLNSGDHKDAIVEH